MITTKGWNDLSKISADERTKCSNYFILHYDKKINKIVSSQNMSLVEAKNIIINSDLNWLGIFPFTKTMVEVLNNTKWVITKGFRKEDFFPILSL